MPGLKRKGRKSGGAFTFRVSDVVDVPLRGTLLRLRLIEGEPSMADLGVGGSLQLRSAEGEERVVSIMAHSVTGGKATQERLDRTRELDVMIDDEAAAGPEPIEIGWIAAGPVA